MGLKIYHSILLIKRKLHMNFNIPLSLTGKSKFDAFFAAITDLDVRSELLKNKETPDGIKELIHMVNDNEFISLAKKTNALSKENTDKTVLKESANKILKYIKEKYPQAMDLMTLYARLTKTENALTDTVQINTNIDINAEVVANAVVATNTATATDVAVAAEVFVVLGVFII